MKTIHTLKKISFASLLFSIAGVSTASADVIQKSAAWSLAHDGTVNITAILSLAQSDSNTKTASTTANLQQFDSSLGTLQSVTLTFTTTSSSYAVTRTGLVSLLGSGSVQQALSYSVASPTYSGTNSVTASGGTLLSLLGSAGAHSISGATLTDTHTFTSAQGLSAFIGSGLVPVAISSQDLYSITTTLGVGSISITGNGNVAGTLTADYNYTPIPEPSTYGLLTAAGAGIFGISRVVLRKRKTAPTV